MRHSKPRRLLAVILKICLVLVVSCGDDDSEDPGTGNVPEGVVDERERYTVSTLTESFNGSGGLAVDAQGLVYVADFGDFINNANGNTVSRINPTTGEVTTFATGLVGPSGNTFAPNGNLFQSNIAGNSISEITPDGEVSRFSGQGLSSPVGLALDQDGNLYACNCGSQSIQILTPTGSSTRFATSSLLNCPNGLTIDDQGNLYTANFNDGRIIKINPDASLEILATLPGGNNAHIAFKNGGLYVLSRGGHQLYRVSLDGVVTLIAGSGSAGNEDGSGELASFNIPNGIDLSPDGGRIYITSRLVGEGTPLNPVIVRVIELK